jgi:hypothetical protein
VGAAFLAFGGISWWRGHTTAPTVLWGVGGALAILGLVGPTLLGPVHRAWMGLAHLLSKVTTPIFMGLVYFVVLTPVGFLRRTLGRPPLEARLTDDSYWVTHEGRPDPRAAMNRQF